MSVKFHIDADKCIASGACAIVAPEVFGIDDLGMITVVNDSPQEGLRSKVTDAAAACPAWVITVEDA